MCNAGKYTKGKIGRISGIDPAGPYFEGTPDYVHLNKNDAQFVDNFHTNGEYLITAGFGTLEQWGDVDFYPNGGKEQPGCRNIKIGCSHEKAPEYYIESVVNAANGGCQFKSLECDSEKNFNKGKCDNNAVSEMGLNAVLYGGNDKKYFLETSKNKPFCLE